MKNSGNIFGGIILGLAAGVAIGILIAPDKGSETLKKLLSKAQDLGDDFKEKLNAGIEKFEEVKDITENKTNSVKNKSNSLTTKKESSAA